MHVFTCKLNRFLTDPHKLPRVVIIVESVVRLNHNSGLSLIVEYLLTLCVDMRQADSSSCIESVEDRKRQRKAVVESLVLVEQWCKVVDGYFVLRFAEVVVDRKSTRLNSSH